MGKLFGTDGVRGIVNKELTPELALKLGISIGTFFGEYSRILIGRDARAGGEMLMHSLIAGLLSAGVKVFIAYPNGYAPTPAIQYAVKELGYDGGVIITASHNPPNYNGIKVVNAIGIELDRESERTIEEIYFSEKFHRAKWSNVAHDTVTEHRVIDSYLKSIIEHVDKQIIKSREFRVLVDCANSVSSLTTPTLLRQLGVKPLTVGCDISPYPYREPEPTPSTLSHSALTVKQLNLDLGVGHDGDADRAIFIDENGEIWWGDRTGSVLSSYIAEKKLTELPRRVYTAVSSSKLVVDYLSHFNIEVAWTPVGSIYISYNLLERGGIAGFEENGGFIYPPHLLARDGAMTTALLLELLAVEKKKPSQLFSQLPRMHSVKTKVPMSKEVSRKVVKKLTEKYLDTPYRVVTIDGLRVEAEDFWFLVRPSGTEPVLRIMVEAYSREKAKKLANNLIEEVRRMIGNEA